MKSEILLGSKFTIKGKGVLDAIMNESIPSVDLLVRESMQNSLDAILPSEDFASINLLHGKFDDNKFNNYFNGDENFNFRFNRKNDFLAISDKNTTGLLGGHIKEEGKPNNLYNLLYDLYNPDSKTGDAGGAWGIGKSVYYRFGVGFCVYYTRTFEDNRYINKLAVVYIENQLNRETACIKKPNNNGIAFFGELDVEDNSMPIYDDEYISNFLNTFNLELYNGKETGTMVIIPYFDTNTFVDESINKERNYWRGDFENTLEISLQRWFFARINNKKYDGKYMRVAINNEPVELNKFFSIYQKMYNLELSGCIIEDIGLKSPQLCYGTLILKKFKREELFMSSPDNYPSPYVFLDVNEESELNKQSLICYLRKAGMVITHDEKWNNCPLEEDEFLLGLFKLYDDCEYDNEKLGSYVRSTEVADHMKWKDAYKKDFPYFTKKQPIRHIWKNIDNTIKKTFKKEEVVEVETSNSQLRKMMGNLLLPPTGFGKTATVATKKPSTPGQAASKKKNSIINYEGFKDGYLKFSGNTLISKSQYCEFKFLVCSGSKKISFREWIQMGFELPCEFKFIQIENMKIGNSTPLENLPKFELNDETKNKRFDDDTKLKLKRLSNKQIEGFILENSNDRNSVLSTIGMYIKPLDDTYSITIEAVVKDLEGVDSEDEKI